MCFTRDPDPSCTQSRCDIPLNVSLAPPVFTSFEVNLSVSLEPDLTTGTHIGGYIYARSLVLATTAGIPVRFFGVYVRPRQQGMRVYYVALNSVVQHQVDFPGVVLDDGDRHTLRIQVCKHACTTSPSFSLPFDLLLYAHLLYWGSCVRPAQSVRLDQGMTLTRGHNTFTGAPYRRR